MDVIRNFMSDERNFEYIDGHLKLQSITERLALREDVLSKYTKVFNDGLSMLQEKFRADRQRVFDSQMEDFSEDMQRLKESHKAVVDHLERLEALKSTQNKDWIRYAKLTDEENYAVKTWLEKRRQIEEAISNDERKPKIQSLIKAAEIESERYCELKRQRIALFKPNSDVVKEMELSFENVFGEFNASTAK